MARTKRWFSVVFSTTVGMAALTPAVRAQTIINDGDSLDATAVTINSGDTLTFLGNATLTDGNTLPAGAVSFISQPGTSLIDFNGAGNLGSSAGAILNLDGNFTFANANGAGSGAVFNNTGGGLRLSTTNGRLTFQDNQTSGAGGAIYSTGDVTLTGNAIILRNNQAIDTSTSAEDVNIGNGGAVYGSGTVTLGTAGGTVELDSNTATHRGGAVWGNVVVVDGDLTATNNSSVYAGGAINAETSAIFNGNATFEGNSTSDSWGGAVNTHLSNVPSGGTAFIHFTNPAATVTLRRNTASGGGGALNSNAGIEIAGGLVADHNVAYGEVGGALRAWDLGITVATAAGSGNVSLTNNTALGDGGALATLGETDGGTTFVSDVALGNAQGTVTITGNHAGFNVDANLDPIATPAADANGGGINADGTTTLTGSAITLANNFASMDGGGIYSNLAVTINGNLTADGNDAVSGNGGAINGQTDVQINGNLSASGNIAGQSGGVIYAEGDVTATGAMSMTGNHATQDGGAIRAGADLTLNPTGASSITSNIAGGNGGALWSAGNLAVNATSGEVLFGDNRASGLGGAIYVDSGTLTLNAAGGDIAFTGNRRGLPGAMHANAFYINNSAGNASALLNTAAGNTITFFDPIASNSANGLLTVTKTGAGMVSFDGALHTDSVDLTSAVYATTQVNAGTFEVANNAVYGTHAVDVGQTAASTFSMASGTTLQGGVAGTVIADQVTLDGATLDIAGRQPNARGVFTLDSNTLTFGAGSRVLFNTELNSGEVQNTDLLVLKQGATTGSASILVTNAGGAGTLTVGNGIRLVQVENGATTTPATFTLGRRVVAGAYEYDLYQGGVDADANDGNWYLRSLSLPPDNISDPQPSAPRPETGVYLRNLTAVSGMFMHTLHDRLGEPQFTDKYKDETNSKVSSLWIRTVGNHTEGNAASGEINMSTDTALVHLGGDLARWSNNDKDRWLFGLMGAYGQSDTDAEPEHDQTTNGGIRRTASGKVDGYSAGAYLTWYGNKDKPTGPYIDLWGLYGWYHNQVQGNSLPEENYHSEGWTVSAETGYAFVAKDGEKRQWIIEPQAQVAYGKYDEENHREQNGSWVTDGSQDGVTTRLGVRAYTRSKLGNNGIQPFVELNWWHGSAQNTLRFNGDLISDGTPKDTYELKAGLQGEIARHWQIWGHLGWRQGGNDYTSYEGMLGVKYQF